MCPAGQHVRESLFRKRHFSLAQFGTIAHQLVYRTAIINSLWVTLLSTAVGLVIDFFLALALYGDHGRKKTLYLSLLNLTSTFPVCR